MIVAFGAFFLLLGAGLCISPQWTLQALGWMKKAGTLAVSRRTSRGLRLLGGGTLIFGCFFLLRYS